MLKVSLPLSRRYQSLRLSSLVLPLALLVSGQTAFAEEVVQPLPPPGVADLNSALTRLARNSRDVDALIDAGSAALELGDIDAAIGFFGRADDLWPGNARVKVGLAGAFVRSERPLEALRLFDEAERAGASTVQLAVERGLAFDLVGDNANAQAQYRIAVARRSSDEAVRRLALSHAIVGDREGFEATLLPLLNRQDRSGFRIRAFGLAILGQEAEAVSIARIVMPPALSARIIPYLQYMPRLTRAQQAAAGNLGNFPRAAQIGRDDPRIAQYVSSTAPAVSTADARLTPMGRALGAPVTVAANSPAQTGPAAKPKRSERRTRVARTRRDTSGDRLSAVRARSRERVVAAASVPKPITAQPTIVPVPRPSVSTVQRVTPNAGVGELPAVRVAAAGQAAVAPTLGVNAQPTQYEPTPPIVVRVPEPLGTRMAVVQTIPSASPIKTAAQSPIADDVTDNLTEGAASTAIRPGFDLAAVAPQNVAAQAAPEPKTMTDAFATFSTPKSMMVPPSAGAVDITAIKPAREQVREAPGSKPSEAMPAKPSDPSRIWVQVATGKDQSALRYDWRKMARKAPATLDGVTAHVAPWGQTNRLLAGPYASAKEARDALATLGKAGIDGFRFTSKDGEEIKKLP